MELQEPRDVMLLSYCKYTRNRLMDDTPYEESDSEYKKNDDVEFVYKIMTKEKNRSFLL